MDITQVLACVRAILNDDPMGMEITVAAIKSTHVSVEGIVSAPTECYVCEDPNHIACECLT